MMKLKSKLKPRTRRLVMAAAETTPVAPAGGSFAVIAMAASVGGLKALSVILGGLPADFPAAIAIVMHLSPLHKSILAEILNSRAHLVVKQAHTGDILCLGSVFVAPPNHHLLVTGGGRLELSSAGAAKVHHARPSAEPLFASVAAVYGQRAIAVVLTGGDGDGSFGVQIIKEQGGTVIAQDRPTSQDFSMPESAIKTGDVDFILPLEAIAPKLLALVRGGRGRGKSRTMVKGMGTGLVVAGGVGKVVGRAARGKPGGRRGAVGEERSISEGTRGRAAGAPAGGTRGRAAGAPAGGTRGRAARAPGGGGLAGGLPALPPSYPAGTKAAMIQRQH